MNRENLTKDVGRGLEISIVVSIFFPSFLTAFFDLLQKTGQLPEQFKNIDQQLFSWWTLAGVYIICYLLFEVIKRRDFPVWIIWILYGLVLVGIFFFTTPIVFLSTFQATQQAIPSWLQWVFPSASSSAQLNLWLYHFSMNGLLVVPMILFFTSVVLCVVGAFRKKVD